MRVKTKTRRGGVIYISDILRPITGLLLAVIGVLLLSSEGAKTLLSSAAARISGTPLLAAALDIPGGGVFAGMSAETLLIEPSVLSFAAAGSGQIHINKTSEGIYPTLGNQLAGRVPFIVRSDLPGSGTEGGVCPAASPPARASSVNPISSAPDENKISEITVMAQNPDGYDAAEGVYVKNNTKQKVDVAGLLGGAIPFRLTGGGPHVLIIHTHGSEAYLSEGENAYEWDTYGRTEDTRYNVVRVGDEIEKILAAEGISVIHDRNIYDSPSFNGSYTRALEAISAQMAKTPSIKVIIDVHRDSMVTKEGVKYRPVVEIDGRRAAQVMLVMGTGEGGLPHPDWMENLKLALKIQKSMADNYSLLARPVYLTSSRYNQHAATGSMIVEVGTSENTLDEAIYGAQLFAKSVAGVLNTPR